MSKTSAILLGFAALLAGTVAQAGPAEVDSPILPWLSGERLSSDEPRPPRIFLPTLDEDRHGLRPVLSVSLLDQTPQTTGQSLTGELGGWLNQRFFWSLEGELRPALPQPRAHIQCQRGIFTATAYRAEGCSFVSQPLPDDSLNLVQVRGQWLATPNVSLGLGVFRGNALSAHSSAHPAAQIQAFSPLLMPVLPGADPQTMRKQTEGIDLGVSVGLDLGRLGDLLVDLQMARYRDTTPALSGLEHSWPQSQPWQLVDRRSYHNAAQLALGWRRGDFSTNIQGHYRDNVLLPGSALGPATLNTFDIEFSWRTSWNAALSVGANNLLRSHPEYEGGEAPARDDPYSQVFGRIPYVRYKQDL